MKGVRVLRFVGVYGESRRFLRNQRHVFSLRVLLSLDLIGSFTRNFSVLDPSRPSIPGPECGELPSVTQGDVKVVEPLRKRSK